MFMNEEKELLHGKLAGIFYHPSLVLTNRRLIIGNSPRERSINLTEILEAYTKQERLQSILVIRLKDGKTEEIAIYPEKSAFPIDFSSGSVDAQESEMRASSKATTDEWTNLINRYLSSTERIETETPTILSKEPQVQPVAQPAPQLVSEPEPQHVTQPTSQDTVKNDQITPLQEVLPQAQHKVQTVDQTGAEPIVQHVSTENVKSEQMTPLLRALLEAQRKRDRATRLQKLEEQLASNLIAKEDFEKRKREILAEV
jgi:hypothetical protein